MALRITLESKYASDKDRAIKTAQIQIKFIVDNKKYCNDSYYQAVIQMQSQLTNEGYLTPNQMNFIDGIYESVMKGVGLPSVPVHVDKKKKQLRY